MLLAKAALALILWGLASEAWYGGWAGWIAMGVGCVLVMVALKEAWANVG